MPQLPPFPCPCCGYLVFAEPPGSYDICDVCGWEDDLSQLRFVTRAGANAPLIDCQPAFAEPRDWERPASTPEALGYVRDPEWRPLDLAVDDVEVPVSGRDYGVTYADDATKYYYWRSSVTARGKIHPELASRGAAEALRDEELPQLGADWLATGWDSPELLVLASMSAAEARSEARRLLPEVLASLGYAYIADSESEPVPAAVRLRSAVAWAINAMDKRFTPYAAAQKVLEAVEDDGELQEPTERLWALVREYDAAERKGRAAVEGRIKAELFRLREQTGQA